MRKMENKNKNQEQLIEEIKFLKTQIEELEKLESKHRKTDEELRESENRLRNVLETIQEGITFSDETGHFYIYNSTMEKLTGYSMEEANACLDFIQLLYPYPQDQQRAFEGIVELIEKGKSREAEMTIFTKSRQLKCIRVWSTSTLHNDRRMFLSVYQDITERKKAEDALRQSELRHRILLENIPQRVFQKDRNSVYVSCNESYAKELNIKADDIIGKTDYDFYPKELADKYRADDKRIMESGQIQDIEEDYIVGRKKYAVHTVKTPVRDNAGNIVGLLGVFWDITKKKEMEKQERLAQLGGLVADMAHEVNNPLMIISGNAQLCLMEEIQSEAVKTNLKIIFEESKRAKDIIQRLLKFSRPSKGELKEIDINKSIEAVVSIVEHQFQLAGTEIKRNYGESLPFITVDEQQIEEVVMNLLNNARDAMSGGGVIEIATGLEKDYLRMDFKDTGCGMSEEVKERAFEPFFTTKEKGTGLGLSVCYGIMKAHNGELEFESKPGKGTIATILLPLRRGIDNV
jgi:PAS domain S-box-containing protein